MRSIPEEWQRDTYTGQSAGLQEIKIQLQVFLCSYKCVCFSSEVLEVLSYDQRWKCGWTFKINEMSMRMRMRMCMFLNAASQRTSFHSTSEQNLRRPERTFPFSVWIVKLLKKLFFASGNGICFSFILRHFLARWYKRKRNFCSEKKDDLVFFPSTQKCLIIQSTLVTFESCFIKRLLKVSDCVVFM